MAVQLIRKAANKQPKDHPKINFSNPIARGLVAVFNGSTKLFEPVTGKKFSGSGTGFSRKTSIRGEGVSAVGSGTGKFQVTVPAETDSVTFFMLGSFKNDVTNSRPVSYYNGASNGRFDFYQQTGGAQPIFQALHTTTNGQWYSATNAAWRDGSEHAFCIDYDGSSTANSPSFSVDGVYDSTSQFTSPVGSLVTAGTQLAFCGRPDATTRQINGSMTLCAVWNRALRWEEIKSLSRNPWQIFKADTIPFFFSTVTAQLARPTSDASAGTWTASTGSDLFAMLDETTASDADYIVTTGTSTCEVALTSLSDPASSTGHIVRYRISATSGGITVRLRQGTTTIATWTHSSAPTSLTTYAQTLTSGEADSITDYTALKLQFEAT